MIPEVYICLVEYNVGEDTETRFYASSATGKKLLGAEIQSGLEKAAKSASRWISRPKDLAYYTEITFLKDKGFGRLKGIKTTLPNYRKIVNPNKIFSVKAKK